MERLPIFLIALLILMFTAYPSCCQSSDENASQKLDRLVEMNKGGLINSTQELIKIKSVGGEPEPGAPSGEGPAQALDKVLEIARDLGFNTTNLDGYIGYAEYGNGSDYIGVLAHVDVVPEGTGWTYPPYGAEIHNGRIYGRGSLDDKGPAIASLYALKAVRDSKLPISKRVRIIFGTQEETGVDDIKHYLELEKPPVSGFTPDAYFPAVYAEKGIITFNLTKDLLREPSNIKILSIRSGTAPNIVPDKASAEIIVSDPSYVVTACKKFANKTGYNLTAEETNGSVLIRSIGLAAHGSEPYKGKNAAMQLLAFLGTLDLKDSDIGDAISFLNAKIGMETDGKSFGLAMEDEPSGNLTLNVGELNATETRHYPSTESPLPRHQHVQ